MLDTGLLMRSIHQKLYNTSVVVGTNVKYAPVHQFGLNATFSQTVKPHKRKITQAFGVPISPRTINVMGFQRQMTMKMPARPFMIIQEDDKEYIRKIMKETIKEVLI